MMIDVDIDSRMTERGYLPFIASVKLNGINSVASLADTLAARGS